MRIIEHYPRAFSLLAITIVVSLSGGVAWSQSPAPSAGYAPLKLIKLTTKSSHIGRPEPVLDGRNAVLLAVFTTWCKPCQKEVPILNSLYSETRHRGVRVVAVSTDDKPPAAVRRWMTKKKTRYPVYYANLKVKDGSSILGDVSGIPHTLLLSSQGHVLRRWVGVVPIKALRAAIAPLVKKKKK